MTRLLKIYSTVTGKSETIVPARELFSSARFRRRPWRIAAQNGIYRKGTVFGSEAETSILMDDPPSTTPIVTVYLAGRYLEKKPLCPADSVETSGSAGDDRGIKYSLFQITDVERGVGISVQDLLRNETGFVVDIGFGEHRSATLELGVPDHRDRGLPDNRWSGSTRQSSGGEKNSRRTEADASDTGDLRLQANLPLQRKGGTCRTR